MLPDWFDGDIRQFHSYVMKLEPHHCSYPSGRIKAVGKNQPCMARKLPGQLHCRDHMAHSVSRLHTMSMGDREIREMSEIISESSLMDTAVNVYYAESALARQASICRDGGISTRLCRSLEDASNSTSQRVRKCRELWKKISEIRDRIRAAEAADNEPMANTLRQSAMELQAQWQSVYESLLKGYEIFTKIASVARKDNEHWRELVAYNSHSMQSKESSSRMISSRKGYMAIEESRNAILKLCEIVEQSLEEKYGRESAEQVMEKVFLEFSGPEEE